MAPGSRHLLLLAVAAAAAGAAGWWVYRATVSVEAPARAVVAAIDPRAGPAENSPVEILAKEHSDSAGAPPRPIPAQLPDFSLATREGPPRRLSSFEHEALLVNFWATWCAPCRREIPLLKAIRRDRAKEGVEIVGIAVDFREDVLKYAASIGIDYPLLIGEEDGLQAADAFGVDMVFPFTAFADRKRRIIAVKIGELHANEADFILDRIAEINAGRLDPEQAKPLIQQELKRLADERAGGAGAAAAATRPASAPAGSPSAPAKATRPAGS